MSQSKPQEPIPATSRWQFSLRQIFIGMTLLSIVMAGFSAFGAIFTFVLLFTLVAGGWMAFLLNVATSGAPQIARWFRWGVYLAIFYLAVAELLTKIGFRIPPWYPYGGLLVPSRSFRDFEPVVYFISTCVGFINGSTLMVSLWSFCTGRVDWRTRWAANWTVVVWFLNCLLTGGVVLLAHKPETDWPRADFWSSLVFAIQWPMLVIVPLLWLIAVRRKKLQGLQIGSSSLDRTATASVLALPVLFAMACLIAALGLLSHDPSTGPMPLLVPGLRIALGLAFPLTLMMLVVGIFRQWFRDRWQFWTNLPAILLLCFAWLMFLHQAIRSSFF